MNTSLLFKKLDITYIRKSVLDEGGKRMQLSEADKIAINDMFSCRNLLEHMACYQHYSDQLENWTFIVFSENNG